MKSAWFSTILLTAVFSLALFGCKKNDNDDNGPRTGVGAGKGEGGTNTITVYPLHNGVRIDSCVIYVKYNTEVNPLNRAGYDDSIKCTRDEFGKSFATFTDLRKGTYLFYGYGWDNVRSQTVEGSRVYYSTTDRTSTNLDLQLHAK